MAWTLGVTYVNDVAWRTFIHHIAATMREDLERLFQQELLYFSLLFDGSTDKSISEKEVVSIKLIENGIPKIKLLGFLYNCKIAEPERCDAAKVEQAIRKLCEDRPLNLKNGFVASAADGPAVNFGEKSGVLTRFKQDAPWLIKMHCIILNVEYVMDIYVSELD
ncbi:uncharacterized protein LOC121412062 [Lytechinus variegatus]|uniref:uncharacterized protein LOC121412062 n=1 Tax=Lytechinus variegatus TaxID=7654 RepID=UPI001BB20D7F|nr:uncharacterized protein LOC121412062 [Lytechinus variegatus]